MPEAPQETIHVLGEGGSVFELALPLHETIAERMHRGQIRRVHPDGSRYDEPSDDEIPAPPTAAPAPTAAKGEWVAWAMANGATVDEAQAMTKQDLIELYGTTG